jgi:hypothetical protein
VGRRQQLRRGALGATAAVQQAKIVLSLIVLIALPLLPLTLTTVPLNEMLDRALKLLL